MEKLLEHWSTLAFSLLTSIAVLSWVFNRLLNAVQKNECEKTRNTCASAHAGERKETSIDIAELYHLTHDNREIVAAIAGHLGITVDTYKPIAKVSSKKDGGN